MATEKRLSVRLSAEGDKQLKRDLESVGQTGQRSMNRITSATRPATAELRALNAAGNHVNGMLRQAAALIGAYAGLQGIKGFSGFVLRENKAFESYEASLKSLTGSVDEARRIIQDLDNFAANTPFQLDEVVQGFTKLKALGLDPSEEALRSYGNTASALNKTLDQFVEAVADAVTLEFERLKEFGIKARQEGDKVSFTFQGVTTTVRKNAEEIEGYLRTIGNVNFSTAMIDQMDTLNGVISNMDQNLSGFARKIGEGGFNDAIRAASLQVTEFVAVNDDLATSLGENLGAVIRVSTDALLLFVEHGQTAVTVIGGLVVARTASSAITALNAAIIGPAGAVAGLRMMATVSPLAAAGMASMAVASRAAAAALALVGGPVGAAVIAAGGLYLLATRQSDAAREAESHRQYLKQLNAELDSQTRSLKDLHAEKINGLDIKRLELEQQLLDLEYRRKMADQQKDLAGSFAFAPNLSKIAAQGHLDGQIRQVREDLEKTIATIERYKKVVREAASPAAAAPPATAAGVASPAALSFEDEAALLPVKTAARNAAAWHQAEQRRGEALAQTKEMLADMVTAHLRAEGNITAAIARESEAQIEIWRARAAAGIATEQEKEQAISLIRRNAARETDEYLKSIDQGRQAGEQFADTWRSIMIEMADDGEVSFDRIGRAFKATISQMLIDALLMNQVKGLFGQIFSGIGAAFGLPVVVPSAKGNVVERGNVVPFALGGVHRGRVVTGPEYFPLANGDLGLRGEAGPEGILPLERASDGKLGVNARMASSPVIVNIYNQSGEKVETRERRGSGGAREIDVYIGQAGARDVAGRGPMAQTLEATYGLKRIG